MNKQAVVIGAGIGGLSSAALLAKDGWQVTVLEKNPEIGGRGRVWTEKGFVFDMGPSWYLMPEVFDDFFQTFGKNRENYYQLIRLDPSYRVWYSPQDKLDIPAQEQNTQALFEEIEPGAGRRLQEYIDLAEYKYRIAMNEFMYRDYRTIFDFFNKKVMTQGLKLNIFTSLDKYVRKYFSNPRLRQILEYAMVFLGNSPYNAPAMYPLMSYIDIRQGVWYPEGGMGKMVEGIARLAREQGVTIRTGSPVRRILTSGNTVCGVETEQGIINASLVLANADYHHVETDLLAVSQRSFSPRYWKKRVMGPSMFLLYLGVDKKIPALTHHNLFLTEPWDRHFQQIFDQPDWPELPCYYVSCPSRSDASVAPAGQENIFVLVPTAPGLDETPELREAYADKTLRHLENLIGENLRDHLVVRRIFTGRDFQTDYNAYKGTALSLAHTLFQTAVFRPSHRSKKVKGLYYSSHYTHPGVGVPMTIISSHVAAMNIAREML